MNATGNMIRRNKPILFLYSERINEGSFVGFVFSIISYRILGDNIPNFKSAFQDSTHLLDS